MGLHSQGPEPLNFAGLWCWEGPWIFQHHGEKRGVNGEAKRKNKELRKHGSFLEDFHTLPRPDSGTGAGNRDITISGKTECQPEETSEETVITCQNPVRARSPAPLTIQTVSVGTGRGVVSYC